MIQLKDFLESVQREKWKYTNTMDKLITCRGVQFYFQNEMLKYIEDSRIRVYNIADIKIKNAAMYLYDDFGEEMGYIKNEMY